MAINPILTQRIRNALAHLPDVEEKKMFSGIAFMVDGKMCVTAGDDEMMCRIDPEIHDSALSRPGSRTMIMRGKEYIGYIKVKESAIERDEDFQYWIDLALDFNKRAKASKKRKKK